MFLQHQLIIAACTTFYCINIARATPIPSTTAVVCPAVPVSTNPSVQAAPNKPNATISVPVQVLDNQIGYTIPMQLGEERQTFNLFLDTLSFISYVDGSDCQSCGTHTLLGGTPTKNITATTFSFSNLLGSEKVSIHQVDPTPATIGSTTSNLSLFVATEADNITASAPFDGVAGFALGPDPDHGVPNFVQQLAEQGIISAPVLTFKLPSITNTSYEGELHLGDPTSLIGDATRVTQSNTTINGFWDLQVSVNVNGKPLALSNATDSAVTARLSTRERDVVMPFTDMQVFIDAVPDARKAGSGFMLPCNATTDISFNISGKSFAIPPQNYISSFTSKEVEGFCFAYFTSWNETNWALGSPFMSSVYTSLDYTSGSITIADI